MTKTIFAIALAAVATAGAASAATPSLVNGAQNLLNEYGFNVDASDLTDSEIVGLHFVDASEDQAPAEVKARIAAVIN